MMDQQTERRKLQKQQIILYFTSIFQTQKQFSTLSNCPENFLSNLRLIILTFLLLLKKWADPKTAAATAALFIWVNSIAGLVGAGISGIIAAKTAALNGFKTLLVEEKPNLGGSTIYQDSENFKNLLFDK